MKKISALILAFALVITVFSSFAEPAEDRSAGTVLDSFLEPESQVKPMARMWFPDAGAGEDDDDSIERQILELADKGFGGAEVGMLMSFGVHYTNEESRFYGWGTENWTRVLKKVLKAAAKAPGGFRVDMTITGHWPPVLNTLDPNDAAASKELSFSVTPITAEDLANGTVRLRELRHDGQFPGRCL